MVDVSDDGDVADVGALRHLARVPATPQGDGTGRSSR
jgi:hypothetical protein